MCKNKNSHIIDEEFKSFAVGRIFSRHLGKFAGISLYERVVAYPRTRHYHKLILNIPIGKGEGLQLHEDERCRYELTVFNSPGLVIFVAASITIAISC